MLVVSIINGNDSEIEGDFNFDQLIDIFDILLFSEYLTENS